MSQSKFDVRNKVQTAETTLDLLEMVADDANISQRGLAARLGVALGMTNAVLKRCAKKGWLKVQQAPAKRFAYYLTPKGFAEKARLTAEYLNYSLEFYREARQEFFDLYQYCNTRGWDRVIVVGASDLSEIAMLASQNTDVEITGFLDPARNVNKFCGLPIYRSLDEIDAENRPKAVIIADVASPQSAYDRLIEIMPEERVLAPKMMRVTKSGRDAQDGDDA